MAGSRAIYLIVAVVAIVTLGYSAHLGGVLVYDYARRHGADGGRSSSVGSRESFVGAHFLGSDSDGVRADPALRPRPRRRTPRRFPASASKPTDSPKPGNTPASSPTAQPSATPSGGVSHVMESKQVEGPR